MALGDPTTCVYQFIFNENDSNNTNILQYFIMHRLGLCIKLDDLVAHIVYAYSFINNTAVPIAIKQNNFYFIECKNYCICLGIC